MAVNDELEVALASPAFRSIKSVMLLDFLRTRDEDVLDGELLDGHLTAVDCSREDWERWQYLRANLTPDYRPLLVQALAKTKHDAIVELIASTCTTSRELTAAIKRPSEETRRAIDYASRRFLDEPAVARRLAARAKPFATTVSGAWKQDGESAWYALFVSDTRESADILGEMLAHVYAYTNHGPKERMLRTTAKRIRALEYRRRCRKPVMTAFGATWSREEVIHTAVAIDGAKLLPAMKRRWEDSTRNGFHFKGAIVTLGGMLLLAPTPKLHDIARAVVGTLIKEKQAVGLNEVGTVNGIAMAIAGRKIRALYPLLETIAKWKFTGSPYDNHGAARAELAGELLRRRAASAF